MPELSTVIIAEYQDFLRGIVSILWTQVQLVADSEIALLAPVQC